MAKIDFENLHKYDAQGSIDPVDMTLIENITAKDLGEKEFDPLKWVVDNLIPEGLTVLAGAPKIGKSFLCWNLALAVAQQGRALSHYPVSEKKNVLYFALEDPQRQIQSRLRMIQPYDDLPDNLNIYTRFPIILSEDGIPAWEQVIEENQAEFIVVDTMHHVLPQADKGTAYQQDYKMLSPVQQMVHRLGISMMLVTHTRKAADEENPFNQIQGSVGVQAACDTMMMLVTSDGDKTLHIRGREVMDTELAVEISNGVFISTSTEERQESKMSDTRSVVFDALRGAGSEGLTVKSIKELIPDVSEDNLRQTLRRMVKDNQAHQPKARGKYYYGKSKEFQTELDEIPL